MSEDLATRALQAIDLLESIVDDRARLAALPEELRRRLLVAAGRASRPERDAMRKMAKALRKNDREEVRRADDAILASTGMRDAQTTRARLEAKAPSYSTPPSLPPPIELDDPDARELIDPRKCYVCKAPFVRVHAFYDQLCEPCATLNWAKRHQSADLRGRFALVTGARVKIGYHAALKLLRAGAHVVVTTRFPHDAADRYAREEDFESFRDRLEVHGLDLRHTPSVEAFAHDLSRALPRLDFILHNACQTVRRPTGFYAHLMERERAPIDAAARALLPVRDARAASSAELSQVPLLPEDLAEDLRFFPDGVLDADLQQVDLRARNSWRLTLAEVPSIELLEVHLVNAIAPFVLSSRLKPLMMRAPHRDKHVVNVSAMEGQFYRAWKTDRHPHTNMAKAALNMLTRTSAADYVKDGIHMNSVDTGWITDEDPAEVAARKVEEHRFSPPLDAIDGAARICDPIFDGFLTGEHRFGLFFKDYAPAPW